MNFIRLVLSIVIFLGFSWRAIGQISLPIGSEEIVREYSATNTTSFNIQTYQEGDEGVIAWMGRFREKYFSYQHMLDVVRSNILDMIDFTVKQSEYDPSQPLTIFFVGNKSGKLGGYETFFKITHVLDISRTKQVISEWDPEIYTWVGFESTKKVKSAKIEVHEKETGQFVSSHDTETNPSKYKDIWLDGDSILGSFNRILMIRKDFCTKGGVAGPWDVVITLKFEDGETATFDGNGKRSVANRLSISFANGYPVIRFENYPVGATVTIQSSSDMKNWVDWKSIVIYTGSDQVIDNRGDESQHGHHFYRTR